MEFKGVIWLDRCVRNRLLELHIAYLSLSINVNKNVIPN